MYFFLFLFIPAAILLSLSTDKDYSWKAFVPPMLFALLTAIVICFIKGFFIFSEHTWTMNVLKSYSWLTFRDIILVFILAIVPFCIFSKDDAEYKSTAVRYLLATFYAVFIPFTVLTEGDSKSWFLLLIKPVIYAFLSLGISTVAGFLTEGIRARKAKNIIIASVILILDALIPPALEILWYYEKTGTVLTTALSLLYIILQVQFKGTIGLLAPREGTANEKKGENTADNAFNSEVSC